VNQFFIDSDLTSKISNIKIQIDTEHGKFKRVQNPSGYAYTRTDAHVRASLQALAWSHGVHVDVTSPVPETVLAGLGVFDVCPAHVIKPWLDSVLKQVREYSELSNEYCENVWKRHMHFASKFAQLPGRPSPVYDFISSKTGRPSVISGHNYTNETWSSRVYAISNNGCLYYVDMSEFEARVLGARVGIDFGGSDAYMTLAEMVGIPGQRDDAKLTVLASVFGAGKNFTESKNLSLSTLGSVRSIFKIDELAHSSGPIVTPHGRKIAKPEARLVPSWYTQATAVDIAWQRFENTAELFPSKFDTIAIVHDACIIDAPVGAEKRLTKYFAQTLIDPVTGVSFPVKIKKLSDVKNVKREVQSEQDGTISQ